MEALSLETLRGRLLPEPPALPLVPTRSDYDLNPAVRSVARPALIQAAVLIPIVARAEPAILFTTRSAHLTNHPGQVSFPGGTADPSDSSLTATALRELEEEIAITPDFVTVAGYLEPYETITGFAVLPVVGLLAEGFTVVPQADEVDGVFEVPLRFVRNPDSLQEQRIDFKGEPRRIYAFQYGSHYIWGATAAMLVNLRERLF